jgi:phage tail sheath protein FI
MLTSDLAAAINSSYGALYWGWTKILDSSSRQYVWIPPSGHVTGVIARTARVAEKWYAPAGTRRGHLVTAVDVEYNPGGSERDLLQGSGNAVNPLVKFPQQGIIVMGQRTLQRSETALSRVNVRMLINDMKKGMTTLLRDFIFEPHDSQTWAAVRNVLNPYCADIQARRGLDGFLVVCDERNNTPERRDRYQLWVSVFLKPTRAIEFVLLNLIILQSSASFLAEEVLAAGGVASQAQAV